MANYTILIIDYEPRSIQKLRAPLEAAGYKVHVAQDGLAGIEAFNKLKPSLTMIEAMLPKKHGFEVCQELKQTPHGKATPILIITSVYKGRKYRTQALHQYGCNEYLEKPIDPEKLLSTIGALLPKPAVVAPPPPTAEAQKRPATPAAAEHPKRPATPAAAENPKRPAPPTPPKAAAPSPVGDLTEIEIMERLEEILPGERRKSEALVSPEPPAVEKILSFDPERSRKRRKSQPITAGGAPSPPGAASMGGMATTASSQHLAREVMEPVSVAAPEMAPEATADVDVRAEIASERMEQPRSTKGWLVALIVLFLLLAAGGAVAFLVLTAP